MGIVHKVQGASLLVVGIWNLISQSKTSLVIVTIIIGINALIEVFS